MDTERLKEILDKIPFEVILAIFVAYTAFDLYSFTSADDSPLVMKVREIETAKQQNQALAKKLKEAEEFYRSLEAKKVQLRELAQRLDEMKATLTEDLDVAAFLKVTTTEAKKTGLSLQSLKPADSVKKE